MEVKTFLHGLSTRLEDLQGKATQYKGYQKNFKVRTYVRSVHSLHLSCGAVALALITSRLRRYAVMAN